MVSSILLEDVRDGIVDSEHLDFMLERLSYDDAEYEYVMSEAERSALEAAADAVVW